MADGLPSISELVARFTGVGTAAAAPVPAHAAPVDESNGKGGTATDPAVAAVAPVPAATEATPEAAPAVTTPSPAKVEPPKRDPSSSRFAALTRKEKEVRQQVQEADRRVKEAEARDAALKEREARWESAKKRPVQALKELGFSYADVTADLLGNYKEPEEDPVDKKLKPMAEKWDKFEPKFDELTKEISDLKAALSAKEQATSYNQAIESIKETIAGNLEAYELVSTMGDEAVDLIRDVIVEYWQANQKMLDYSEAASIVESYYEREYLEKLASTNKLKSRFPATKASPEASKPSPKKEAKEPTTLTNSLSSGSQAKVDLDSMSKQDAIAYLAKKLQFKDV